AGAGGADGPRAGRAAAAGTGAVEPGDRRGAVHLRDDGEVPRRQPHAQADGVAACRGGVRGDEAGIAVAAARSARRPGFAARWPCCNRIGAGPPCSNPVAADRRAPRRLRCGRMRIYAERPGRVLLQLLADAAVLTWVYVVVQFAQAARDVVLQLQGPAGRLVGAGDAIRGAF